MPRRLLWLLLAVGTGCPHSWRKGGAIDMMIEKNIWDNANSSNRSCQMSPQEWDVKCKNFTSKTREEKFQCPLECQPGY